MSDLDLQLHPRVPPIIRALPHVESLSLFRAEEGQEEEETRQMLAIGTMDELRRQTMVPAEDVAPAPPTTKPADSLPRPVVEQSPLPAIAPAASTAMAQTLPPSLVSTSLSRNFVAASVLEEPTIPPTVLPTTPATIAASPKAQAAIMTPVASGSTPPIRSTPAYVVPVVIAEEDDEDDDEPMPTIDMDSDSD